jgi:excisionase family DNA binding protein
MTIDSDRIEEDDDATIGFDQWAQTLTDPTRAVLAQEAEKPSLRTFLAPQEQAGRDEPNRDLAAALGRLADVMDRVLTAGAPQALPPEALSKEDAAKFLGVSVPTIQHLIRTRKIQYVQLGSQRGRVIPVEALRKLLQDHLQVTGEEELRRRRGRR